MRLFSKSNVATIAIVSGLVVAAGSGGAVAGAMITGKQIKDGTVTGTDIKNGSIRTSDLSSDTRKLFRTIGTPTVVTKFSDNIQPGFSSSLSVTCPAGRTAVSGQGGWNQYFSGSSIFPTNDGKTWQINGTNAGAGPDLIYLSVICVKVS